MVPRLMLMFPGVGSHHCGMGKTFYDEFRVVRDIFTEASDILHCDLGKLCFSPEQKSELDRLENAQAALLCVSVASYRVFVAETGCEQAIYLGYSLGEYSALCCAGALTLRDALLLVRDRGLIVTDVAASIDGSMAWVVNITAQRVEQICEALRQEGEAIYISAYDSPVKTSLSGTHSALRKAGERVVESGGIPIPIKMSGPFHSPLMQAAADSFRRLLDGYRYQKPRYPVIANVTARPYEAVGDIPHNLMLQLVNPVRWQDSLTCAFGRGVTTSVEIGPKNVLTYVLEKNKPDLKTYVLDTVQAMKKFHESVVIGRDDYLRFLSQSLTTIVGTKNYNEDPSEYEQKVILPFKKIQKAYEEVRAGKVVPNPEIYQDITVLIDGALRAKGMSETEIAARIKKLSLR